jgi:5-methylcytosine-specific restriction endonuclease McrA
MTRLEVELLQQRDGPGCFYCRRTDLALTIDHRIPKSRGGADTAANVVAACMTCNASKGVLTDEEFQLGMRRRLGKEGRQVPNRYTRNWQDR